MLVSQFARLLCFPVLTNPTTRKSKCYQMVLFLNEVIGPYVFTIFCVDIFSFRGILKNGHEVSSRVVDMSRTFNHICQNKFLIHVYEQGKISIIQISIILFNNVNLMTLASISQNLPKCLYCISK